MNNPLGAHLATRQSQTPSRAWGIQDLPEQLGERVLELADAGDRARLRAVSSQMRDLVDQSYTTRADFAAYAPGDAARRDLIVRGKVFKQERLREARGHIESISGRSCSPLGLCGSMLPAALLAAHSVLGPRDGPELLDYLMMRILFPVTLLLPALYLVQTPAVLGHIFYWWGKNKNWLGVLENPRAPQPHFLTREGEVAWRALSGPFVLSTQKSQAYRAKLSTETYLHHARFAAGGAQLASWARQEDRRRIAEWMDIAPSMPLFAQILGVDAVRISVRAALSLGFAEDEGYASLFYTFDRKELCAGTDMLSAILVRGLQGALEGESKARVDKLACDTLSALSGHFAFGSSVDACLPAIEGRLEYLGVRTSLDAAILTPQCLRELQEGPEVQLLSTTPDAFPNITGVRRTRPRTAG